VIKSTENQVMALAGVLEAAILVDEVANQGRCDEARMHVALNSIFSLESDSLESIYGGRKAMAPGLQYLLDQYSTNAMPSVDIARYQMALIQLQRRLMRDGQMQEQLRTGIRNLSNLREMNGELDQAVIARMASLYQDTISQLTPRIIVKGKPIYLQSQDRSEQVRALLLAGIRAAVLWEQSGGSRWSLLFGRRAYIESAQVILKGINNEPA